VTGVGPIRRPALRPLSRPASPLPLRERAGTGVRPVRFAGAVADTPIYARAGLQPGDRLVGPAVVEEFGSTTVVFPGLAASVDSFGNLLLTRAT
jgi:N-methylhydantoinase A